VPQGNLVLRGGGDTELGLAQLGALLRELRWAGIREITGDLIVDRSLFRPARIDQGLPPFDDAPEFPYNVIPDALMLNGNLITLELQSNAEQLQLRLLPPLPGVELVNKLVLNDRPCNDWDDAPYWQTPLTAQNVANDGGVRIEFNGFFPRNCTRREALQLLDRTVLADRLMRLLWAELGGSWNGRTLEGTAPAEARVLARRSSRPWGEVLRHLNKTSDNAETRLLFLQLGVAAMAQNPQATTLDLARREVQRWFIEQRIDPSGLVVDNGSGLSRSERIKPMQMARMLKLALTGKNAPDLLMSLPTVGVDGTMRRRLLNTPAQGWARLKTGTLRNVTALAGLVPDPEGRPWVMVAMINAEQAPAKGRPVLDALVNWIATSGPMGRNAMRVGPQAEGP
jgi:serine-type D-Ala-D-Ala carboxypeptidase/endopeptidase (penicillin-binding protein 4)